MPREKAASSIGPLFQQVTPLRQLAGVFGGFAVIIVFGSMSTKHGSRPGSQFGFGFEVAIGLTAAALATVFLLSSFTITRHLGADGSYWQALQDRYRPRIFRGLIAAFILGVAGVAVAASQHEYFAAGLFGAVATVGGAIALAMATGMITPIRYDL
jgi:hypothetical protein